jgi:hypothetical protein
MTPAVFGFLGTIVGAITTIVALFVKERIDRRRKEAEEAPRKALLLNMLRNRPAGVEWRKMETLSGVIGAPRDETARLLIAIGARGSETGEDVWALISERPLPQSE